MKPLIVIGFLLGIVGCQTMSDVAMEAASDRKGLYKNFKMTEGGQESFSFPINKRGTISASVQPQYSEDKGQVTLVIEDPSGQTVVENSGGTPVRVQHRINRSEASGGGLWKVTVRNTSGEPFEGRLKVYYPYEGEVATADRDYPQDQSQEPEYRNEGNVSSNDSGTSGGSYEGGPGETASGGSYEENQGGGTASNEPQAPQTESRPPIVVVAPRTTPRIMVIAQPKMHTTSPKGFNFTRTGSKQVLQIIRPSGPGNIQVKVNWQGGKELAVILNVASQQAYIARKDGTSPLTLTHYFSKEAFDRDKEIKVWVKWFPEPLKGARTLSSFLQLKGKLVVSYPK